MAAADLAPSGRVASAAAGREPAPSTPVTRAPRPAVTAGP